MATNAQKMIELIQARTAYGVPENAPGLCIVQDEDGSTALRLGFDAHRDYITAIGYEAAPEVRADLCAALAALCTLAADKPVMTAYNLTEADLARALSDDGSVDEENESAVSIAVAMLHQAAAAYAQIYVEKKSQGEEWHGNA